MINISRIIYYKCIIIETKDSNVVLSPMKGGQIHIKSVAVLLAQ